MSAEDMDIDTDDGSDEDMVGVEGAGPDDDLLHDMESGNLRPLQQPQIVAAASDLFAATTTSTTAVQHRRQNESIAHDDIVAGNIIMVSLDCETTGVEGILLQLSAEFIDMATKETIDTFNSFVRPPDDAEWNMRACRESHNYSKNDERIRNASGIEAVWTAFHDKCKVILAAKKGILVAWHGTSDCQHVFKIVEDTHKGKLFFPREIEYFCDPCAVIQHYKSCQLHEVRRSSGVVGYGLGTVYEEAFGEPILGAHDSLECNELWNVHG